MKQLRALIIDDSATARRLVKQALESDPEVTVCGMAENGQTGVVQYRNCSPISSFWTSKCR